MYSRIFLLCFLQLAKLRSSSTQTPAPSQKEPSNEEIAALRQRVAELEQILSESKAERNAVTGGKETGAFCVISVVNISVL